MMAKEENARNLTVEALRQAHEELERRVEERTADLVKANAELMREIEEHKRTEEALEKAEEQLRQAQKMEAVGRLAGGVAHDFNNLLSVIISYTSMLAADVYPSSATSRADLERDPARPASAPRDLTRQLLAFSRQQVLAAASRSISNEVVSEMEKMLRRADRRGHRASRLVPGADARQGQGRPGPDRAGDHESGRQRARRDARAAAS